MIDLLIIGLYRRIVEFGSNGDGAVRTSCNDECVDYAKSSAHTSGGSGTEQRMFCTDTFEGNQHLLSFTALKTDKDAIPPNTHIETFGNALPGTFLRNVARSVSQDPMMEKLNGPSKHTYSDCAFLARDRPEMAKGSADNYAYFALSMWLEEIDWANGFAQKRTGTDDDEEIKIMRTIESGRVEHTDAKVGEIYENEIEIDMEQTEKARDMIDAMTRTQLEYQATGLPKPRKHSEFEPVRRHEVAEP